MGAVADDPGTKTYLTASAFGSDEYGIYRLKEDTVGQGEFMGVPAMFKPAPVSVLVTPYCGSQLVLGYLRNIYTTCGNAISVYAHDASGNEPPLRVLRGAATKLSHPSGIYEGQ